MRKDVRYGSRGTVAASVGQKLRTLRKAAKMTQSQLGEALGVKPQQVSKYESGTDSLGLDNLGKVARLFKVTTDQLLGHESGFEEGGAMAFEASTLPARDAVERFVVTLEELLRQARDLSGELQPSRDREPPP